VHPLARALGLGTRHLAEQLGAEAVAEGHAFERSGGRVTQPTFDFEYSKFLPSMT
jgi:hypothetical protein